VRGRASSFAIAVVAAIGAATVARAATPAAHVVRIDRIGDERLDGLVAAVRAELRAAGFKIAADRAGPDGGEATAASVITVSAEPGHAVVVATAAGTASAFSAEVAFTDAGAARRDVNRVALQVAEWLAAIWLPPPAPPRATGTAARAPALATAPPAPEAAPAAPPSTAAVEPVVPPPFAAAPVAPARTAATVRQAWDAPPAASRTILLDFGLGALRAPDFGTQFGFELGAALHGPSPIVVGATPFARLGLGLYWFGPGLGSSNQTLDVNFVSLTGVVGLHLPVAEKVSVEASAGLGLTVVWVAFNAEPASSALTVYPSRRTWVATPGGAFAVVNRLSRRWAITAEVRASWMLPALVFVTSDGSQMGGSYAPMITGALALRMTR